MNNREVIALCEEKIAADQVQVSASTAVDTKPVGLSFADGPFATAFRQIKSHLEQIEAVEVGEVGMASPYLLSFDPDGHGWLKWFLHEGHTVESIQARHPNDQVTGPFVTMPADKYDSLLALVKSLKKENEGEREAWKEIAGIFSEGKGGQAGVFVSDWEQTIIYPDSHPLAHAKIKQAQSEGQ